MSPSYHLEVGGQQLLVVLYVDVVENVFIDKLTPIEAMYGGMRYQYVA